MYKTSLPEPDLPPDVLIALLGIKDAQAAYVPEESRLPQDGEW
jgi:hypothetical protein